MGNRSQDGRMPASVVAPACCLYCQRSFAPSLFRPQQRVCSHPDCQRRRRREYHRQKLRTDEEYCQVCRDSRRKWWGEHPLYQSQYRQAHPALVERNRQAQHLRDQKRRLAYLDKNNLAFDLKRSAAEVWLLGPGIGNLDKNNVAFAKLLIFETVSCNPPPPPVS